jgi:hypothetical protein
LPPRLDELLRIVAVLQEKQLPFFLFAKIDFMLPGQVEWHWRHEAVERRRQRQPFAKIEVLREVIQACVPRTWHHVPIEKIRRRVALERYEGHPYRLPQIQLLAVRGRAPHLSAAACGAIDELDRLVSDRLVQLLSCSGLGKVNEDKIVPEALE